MVNEQWYITIGHLTFAVLIVLSAMQFLERTLPFDGAFYCFKIIQGNNFNIENGRWGAIYNQVIPLLFLKAGCTLKTFLQAYSISFIFCNYFFFLIIVYKFRQVYTALGFVLAQVFFYRYNFYYQVSEIHACLGPAYLLLTMLMKPFPESRKAKIYQYGLIGLLMIWLINTHLLSICMIAFAIGFSLIEKKDLRSDKYFVAILAVVGILFIYKLKSIPKGSYQSERLVDFPVLLKVFSDLGNIEGFKFFTQEIPNNYLIGCSALIIVILFYVWKKVFPKLLLLIAALLCFFAVDMASNINYVSTIVVQNYYPVFGFFITAHFALDVLPNLKSKVAVPVLGIMIAFSVFKITKCGILLTEQVEYIERICNNLRNYNERKFSISEKNMDWDKMWMNWDVPFQSLIISSLNHPDSALTFFINKDTLLYKKVTRDANSFIGVTFSPFLFSESEIPKKYFNLRHSVYRNATTANTSELEYKGNIKISLEKERKVLLQRMYRTLVVNIDNRESNLLIHSDAAVFSYSIIKDGNIVRKGISPVEMDIPGGFLIKNGLKIALYDLKKGKYALTVQLTLNGRELSNKIQTEITIF